MDSCRNKRLTAKTYRYKSETHIIEKRVREIHAVMLMVPTAQTPDVRGETSRSVLALSLMA